MVMNGFDTNFDRANEVYAANTIGFAYMDQPIAVTRDELVRVYLVNVLEYDLINSFHLHGNLFDYFPTGHVGTTPSELTDTVMLCQGQRGILEWRFPYPGQATCSTRTSPSSPSSAGRASSRSRDGAATRAATRVPAWLLGARAAAADRRRRSALFAALGAPGPRRAARAAGRGARGRADGARAGR